MNRSAHHMRCDKVAVGNGRALVVRVKNPGDGLCVLSVPDGAIVVSSVEGLEIEASLGLGAP